MATDVTKDPEAEIIHEIGSAAGHIYQYLTEHGEVSMSHLRKELASSFSRGRIDQAVGWLAHEQKLTFSRAKRTTRVSLTDR